MICSKFFCCFFPKYRKELIDDIDNAPDTSENNKASQLKVIINKSKEETPNQTLNADKVIEASCFDLKHYREYELNAINFTKESIVNLIETELNSNDTYKVVFEKDNLRLSSTSKGSLFSSAFPICKAEVTLRKSLFTKRPKPSIPLIVSFINDIDKRLSWDKGIKEMKVLEGHNEASSSYLLYTLFAKPAFFISEREFLDKKIDFYVNSVYYTFSSSVNDDFYPVDNDIVRVGDYMSTMKIYEDGTSYHFITLSQVDLKMVVSQSLINFTIPSKLKEWFNSLVSVIDNECNEGDNGSQ